MEESVYKSTSPPYTSEDAPTTSRLRHSKSLTLPNRGKRYSEASPTRQRRLLQHRNARFPAKKLSLSNIGSRFSQLIHNNEDPEPAVSPTKDQENVPLKSSRSQISIRRHGSGYSLGTWNEFSSSTLPRKLGGKGHIVIHEDSLTPERPLLDDSPSPSPLEFSRPFNSGDSPIGFDHIQDSLGNVQLREITGNEQRCSLLASSPSDMATRLHKRQKSAQAKAGFNTQEYIDHIEKELQAARSEIISPNTNRSVKGQLCIARNENERLKQEMAEMRQLFEAEVKRTIEQQAEVEVDLRRKVRDLQDQLEQKDLTILDLEVQHDERRLEYSTIDNLKAAIERLEQDKVMLEDENRSMSKRNEVLSELLAMSPTKVQSFELRSPARDRRKAGRPMSMIIPRMPTSPTGRQMSNASSTAASPSASACESFYSPLRSRTEGFPLQNGLGIATVDGNGISHAFAQQGQQSYFVGQPLDARSRRSTLQSQASIQSQTSVAESVSLASKSSSPSEHRLSRAQPKRKPRKFISGSTQLKPLLLPSLNTDGLPSSTSSTFISPYSDVALSQVSGFSDITAATVPTSGVIVTHEELQDQTYMTASPDSDDIVAFADSGVHSTLKAAEYERSQEGETNLTFSSLKPSSQSFTSFTGFDIEALNQIGLPEPKYDTLPDGEPDSTDSNHPNVPPPLFMLRRKPDLNRGHHDDLFPTSSWHEGVQDAPADTAALISSNESWSLCPTTQPRPGHRLFVANDLTAQDDSDSPHMSPVSFSKMHPRSPLSEVDTLKEMRRSFQLVGQSKVLESTLTASTLKVIMTMLSRVSGHLKDVKRDPFALARRVLANAWLSNWKKFGRLSWWVLGLFITPGFGGPKLKEFEWDDFDGEEIARRNCEAPEHWQYSRPANENSNGDSGVLDAMDGSSNASDDKAEMRRSVSWGQSLVLWGKFSTAIMLAIGGAVIKGPGEMLKEIEGRRSIAPYTDKRSEGTVDRSRDSSGETHDGQNLARSVVPVGLKSARDRPKSYSDIRSSMSPPTYSTRSFHVGLGHNQAIPISPVYGSQRDVDETLRALKSPRKRVAEYFPTARVGGHCTTKSMSSGSVRRHFSIFDDFNSSFDDDTQEDSALGFD